MANQMKLMLLSGEDISKIQKRLNRDFFQKGGSVFGDVFAWVSGGVVANLFPNETDDFHKTKVKRMHDAYRLAVDNLEIKQFDGSAKDMTKIAIKIDPKSPQSWTGDIYMVLKSMASLVADGSINGSLLYPDVAANVREQKAEDSIIPEGILPDWSQFSKDAKQTAGIAALAVVGIGGLYLYGLVTANRALSRWRNR